MLFVLVLPHGQHLASCTSDGEAVTHAQACSICSHIKLAVVTSDPRLVEEATQTLQPREETAREMASRLLFDGPGPGEVVACLG